MTDPTLRLLTQMQPKFEPTDDGLEIIDPIERNRCRLTTHEPVTPVPVDCDRIEYPVSSAVEITTEMLTLPTRSTVYVFDKDGSMLDEVQPSEQRILSHGEYILDLSSSLKLYAKLETSVQIYSDADRTYLSFETPIATIIGARSYHTRPAHTITTTAEPTDVMRAVSAFGSALKTTTVERSYPTLRGHPPALERGPKLHIPDGIDRPKTGIRIEVPSELSSICVVTPLAYYLGASIIPGSEPKLITKTGYRRSLVGKDGFQETVERTLKQIFFLDCIVRSRETKPLTLHERQVIESVLDFDLEEAYERSLAKQVELYLEVPASSLESHLPNWQLKTMIDSPEDAIEFLPFFAHDLSIVMISSSNSTGQHSTDTVQTETIEAFTRGEAANCKGSVRGKSPASQPQETTTPTVRQRWEGIDSSSITATAPLAAFHNSIGRTPKDGPIAINVICNDSEMDKELELINDFYGTHQELPFEVTIHHNLTKSELERVFTQESDFCHYIGHIDADGFQCLDGKFDAKSLETVGTKAFLLNACQSREQGLHLIEAGSVGGVVTLGDVVNSGAIGVGCSVARLLNHGFPLYASLGIARKKNFVGNQYKIVGNGLTTISQSERVAPILCSMVEGREQTELVLLMYTDSAHKKGTIFNPHINCVDSYYILPTKTDAVSVTEQQLQDFFDLANTPILTNGTVSWSDNYFA